MSKRTKGYALRTAGLLIIAVFAVTWVASGAELVTAELVGTENHVTVEQGQSANFDIRLSATGNMNSAHSATARVMTVFNVSSTGAVTANTLGTEFSFVPSSGTANSRPVTWTGAPTPYTQSASVTVAATTPIGTYDIVLSTAAGTTSLTGNGLDDDTATTIVVNVVAAAAPPDVTPPTVDCDVPNQSIWYANNVSVECEASDTGSGLANAADASFSLSTSVAQGTETAAASTNSKQVCDAASPQNCVTAGPYTFKVDRKAPSNIQFVGSITDGATYYWGSVPAAPTCSAVDGGSGLKGCSVGGYSNAVGAHTLRATATDNVDNSAYEEVSYTVLGWTTNGFYNPVTMGDPSDVINSVKSGATVPLKFELFLGAADHSVPVAANELTAVSAIKDMKAVKYACGTTDGQEDPVDFTATGKTELRYDPVSGQFVYNWQTPSKQPNNCYKVTITMQDDSTLVAFFKLK